MLNAWSEEQTRCAALDRQPQVKEPSFPFPAVVGATRDGSSSSLDGELPTHGLYGFDSFFGENDSISEFLGYDQELDFEGWSMVHAPNDFITAADPIFPGMGDGDNKTLQGDFEQLGTTITSTCIDNASVSQHPSQLRASPEAYIDVDLEPMAIQRATFPPPTERLGHQAIQRSVTPSSVQRSLPTASCTLSNKATKTYSLPLDQHYSDASSCRKKKRVQQLQHVSKR